MRAVSLGGRFVLSIYLVRYLGLPAVGIFGIVVGIAGLSPALFGFGISYFVNREIISLPVQQGYRLLRDRFSSNLVVVCVSWSLGLIAMALGFLPDFSHPVRIAAIITLEYLAFDLHVALINLRRPVAANFLLFVRSASWILPFVALGYLAPAFRSVAFLLDCWLMALVLNFGMLVVMLRDADFGSLLSMSVDWRGLVAKARRAPLIYMNDVAAAGQVYLDRFIVLKLLGLGPTGLYTLCFSVTHGLYILVATAITQLSMPKLVAALTDGGLAGWRAMIAAEARRALLLAAIVVAVALVVTLIILPGWGFDNFAANVPLFVLMSAASLLKPISDLLNTGLYSLGLDRMLATINLGGILVSACLGAAAIALWGLAGVGLSSVATQILLIAARTFVLSREFRSRPVVA